MLSLNQKGFTALLERGANPNAVVAKLPGMTTSLVGLAAQAEDSFWLKEMIAHQAKLNVATSWAGRPPVVIALMMNRTENVRLLLQSGIDLEFADEMQWTPLQRAALSGKWDMALLLLEAKADWRKKDPNGRTIVDRLSDYTRRTDIAHHGRFWEGRGRVAQWLKEHGAEVSEDIVRAK